jgi:N-methylhydantoinase B/oxoprolinase/acetone carboxylase alpha subunit
MERAVRFRIDYWNSKGREDIREVDVLGACLQSSLNSWRLTPARMLKAFVKTQGTRIAHAVDFMDDGSRIELTVKIDPETGSAKFDLTGTDSEGYANHNAPPAVTYCAVINSLRYPFKSRLSCSN